MARTCQHDIDTSSGNVVSNVLVMYFNIFKIHVPQRGPSEYPLAKQTLC